MFGITRIGGFVRTLYAVSGPLLDETSDDVEEKVATEAAEIAIGSDPQWDNEAMRRLANFLIGVGERLIRKLDANDASA